MSKSLRTTKMICVLSQNLPERRCPFYSAVPKLQSCQQLYDKRAVPCLTLLQLQNFCGAIGRADGQARCTRSLNICLMRFFFCFVFYVHAENYVLKTKEVDRHTAHCLHAIRFWTIDRPRLTYNVRRDWIFVLTRAMMWVRITHVFSTWSNF